MSAERPSRTGAWMMAARPKTLPAAAAPVLVGTALAYGAGSLHLLAACGAAVGALLLQIAVNIANDYFDHVRGIDTADRVGPTRVAASGLLPLSEIRRGLILVLILVVVDGAYLIYRGGLPIAIIGVAAILSALAYSAGPLPLASHGLGDLFVFLFFGPIAVCGTFYVQTVRMTWPAMVASVPVGALITGVLVVNNYRDIETDRAAGKRTLATMLGPGGTRCEYIALLATPYLLLPFLAWLFHSVWVVVPAITAPLTVGLIREMYGAASGEELNRTLAATARLSLLFAVALGAGIVISALR